MLHTDLAARTEAARHDRRLMALYYAWGREDAGDRRLRDASASRVVALDFAEFAADQAAAYASETATSLPAVQDQYARYIDAITPGTRLIHQTTGDEIEITAYDDTTNLVHAHTTPTPDHPAGRSLTILPGTLAGNTYRPALPSRVAQR